LLIFTEAFEFEVNRWFLYLRLGRRDWFVDLAQRLRVRPTSP